MQRRWRDDGHVRGRERFPLAYFRYGQRWCLSLGNLGRQRRHGDRFGVCFQFAVVNTISLGLDVTIGLDVAIRIGFVVTFGLDIAVGFSVGVAFEFAIGDLVMDLTIIFLTLNVLPARWEKFHLNALLRAAGGYPMIVISRQQMELDRKDTKYLIQEGPFCSWNVYRQLLRGAKLAETKYVAVAEDDTLYPRRHFSEFRPPDDAVAYDMSRWSVFSWAERPFFSAIRKHGNFTMIGPRQLVVDAIQEREDKYPNGNSYTGEIGRREVEGVLKVKRNKLVEWHCIDPMVNLCHPQGLSPTYIDTPKLVRKPGELKAIEIPYWGKAADIAAIYNEGVKADARPAEAT